MAATFIFVFGLLIGSFLNVCIYRMPRNESLLFPASHCPACSAAIPPWLNIPVVSYLLLRGRCRSCGTAISLRYPLVELLTALLGLALYLRFGLTAHFCVLALLCASLVVVTFIDLEHQIIPDEISVTGIFAGFVYSLFSTEYLFPVTAIGLTVAVMTLAFLFGGQLLAMVTAPFTPRPEPGELEEQEFGSGEYLKLFLATVPGIACSVYSLRTYPHQGWADSLLGILVGTDTIIVVTLLYYLLRRTEGMGGGDIKLLAMFGAFFGWQCIPFIIFISSLTGSVIGIVVMMATKKDSRLAIPFGPFLVIGALLYIFYGQEIVAWYLNLFGSGGARP